jgi:hypothetical protein
VERVRKVCPRYCILSERLNGQENKLTVDFIKETHRLVDAIQNSPPGSPQPPNRTLWHALYFPEQKKIQISFYLKDLAEPDHPSKMRVVRSNYLEFSMRKGSTTASGAGSRSAE